MRGMILVLVVDEGKSAEAVAHAENAPGLLDLRVTATPRASDLPEPGAEKPQTVREFVAAAAELGSVEGTVVAIIEDEGYRVREGGGQDGTVAAVETCRVLYVEGGADGLRAVLRCVQQAWGMKRDGVRSPVLRAVSRLLSSGADPDRLAEAAGKRFADPADLLRDAATVRAVTGDDATAAVADLLTRCYNAGLRSGRL